MGCEHHWLVALCEHPVRRPEMRWVNADTDAAVPSERIDYSSASVLLVCERCHGFKTFEAKRVAE